MQLPPRRRDAHNVLTHFAPSADTPFRAARCEKRRPRPSPTLPIAGFQGGVHVIKKTQTEEYAKKMIGQTLVTKQSGPEGKPVNTVLMAELWAMWTAIEMSPTFRTL